MSDILNKILEEYIEREVALRVDRELCAGRGQWDRMQMLDTGFSFHGHPIFLDMGDVETRRREGELMIRSFGGKARAEQLVRSKRA